MDKWPCVMVHTNSDVRAVVWEEKLINDGRVDFRCILAAATPSDK